MPLKSQEEKDKRAADMRQRNQERNRDYKRKERIRKQLEEVAGGEVRIEVIRPDLVPANHEVGAIILKLQEALKALDGLTPDEIHQKVTSLTQVLHIRLQLQVNDAIGKVNSPDPRVAEGALEVVKTLMPFINQITELNLKLQAILGLEQSKSKLVGPQRRQIAAPAADTGDWESKFGDTLANKSLN